MSPSKDSDGRTIPSHGLMRVMVIVAVLASVPLLGAAQASRRSGHSGHTHSRLLVGYYGDWNKYCGKCLQLRQVQFGHLSALIYAFADEGHDACSLSNPATDARIDFPVLRQARRRYPRLKILLSVGGGGWAGAFPGAVSNRRRITRLVANCMHLIHREYPGLFNGIDIDWEGPSNLRQSREYTALIRAFRYALGRKAPLTAAVTPFYEIRWKAVGPLLSWINLMTYDYHGPWGDRVTDFIAPLRADRHDPEYRRASSAIESAETMVGKDSVPASKILLGIPFYGRGYAGVSARHEGLYQRYSGETTFGTDAAGSFYYRDIVLHYQNRNGYREYGPDPYAQEVWLYHRGPKGKGVFISYDNPASIRAKVRAIDRLHLGGAMIWDVVFDTGNPRTSLTSALYRDLRKE